MKRNRKKKFDADEVSPTCATRIEESSNSSIRNNDVILNVSGIVRSSSSNNYCFKIGAKDLRIIRILKEVLVKNFSKNYTVTSEEAYFDSKEAY